MTCRLQQLEPKEGEDRRFQQVHQTVNLYQHLEAHGHLCKSAHDLRCMPVGLHAHSSVSTMQTCRLGSPCRQRLTDEDMQR